MHETLDKIRQMIGWYERTSRKANLHQLLDAKDSLVTLNYTLAEEFAKFNQNHKIGYGLRKIGIATEINKFVKAQESHNKAESLAIEEKADIIKEENLNGAIADALYIKLKHSDAVVRAMEQRIAVLRKELEASGKENQT